MRMYMCAQTNPLKSLLTRLFAMHMRVWTNNFVQDFMQDFLNQISKTDFVVIWFLDFKEVRCVFQNRKLLNQMLQLPLKQMFLTRLDV